ncbi:MAG: IMP dehydrogenase, partial [Gimesia sp.]|nr:IMP dehydrogenase [Gimesia sp.]
MEDRIICQGITFDDVLLQPAYSEVMPSEVSVATQLTKNIPLNVPIISSPMDTVTESDMAIGMAQEGGIGIIHKNMTAEQQAMQVDLVKRSEHGVIVDPVTLPPNATVAEATEIMKRRNIGGVPVTQNGKLEGILTSRDLRFLDSPETLISEIMTKDKLITATEDTTLEEAQRILLENKVEKLLLVDENYQLKGLITIKDIDKTMQFPLASKDSRGRLRVGAAVGVLDYDRVALLIESGVDLLVVDSAHVHSGNLVETVSEIKETLDIDVV